MRNLKTGQRLKADLDSLEIDALYQTENSMVQLDELALMFYEVRNAAWRFHAPINGF
jgi:hypothetical protein